MTFSFLRPVPSVSFTVTNTPAPSWESEQRVSQRSSSVPCSVLARALAFRSALSSNVWKVQDLALESRSDRKVAAAALS